MLSINNINFNSTYSNNDPPLNKLKTNHVEWRQKCQTQMIKTSRINMIKRLNQITDIVIQQVSTYMDFKLTQHITKQMFTDVQNSILSWKGVDLTFCSKQKTTFNEYNKTSMNWFNRNKAKIYGN
eukprot:441246_1